MPHLHTDHDAILDMPHQWDKYLRPWFDVEAYQDRINSRVGTNKDDKPIIRLEWAQDPIQHSFSQSTPRFWMKRSRNFGSSEYTYWTVARWVFTKKLEPEQYVPAWEQSRWAMKDENGVPIDKGEPPEEYYTYFMECAVHEAYNQSGWPACCNRAFYDTTKWGEPRSRCWGRYRTPNEFDLQVLSQSVRKMEADKFQDPYRPLSVMELAEIEMAANMQVERAAMQFEEYEREMQRDFNKRYAHILFGEPSPIHDMSVRPSGVIAPSHLSAADIIGTE